MLLIADRLRRAGAQRRPHAARRTGPRGALDRRARHRGGGPAGRRRRLARAGRHRWPAHRPVRHRREPARSVHDESGIWCWHRLSRATSCADRAEELLATGFRLALVAAHDDGDAVAGRVPVPGRAGPTAGSSSNASCPQTIRRCRRWPTCPSRRAGSNGRWRDLYGIRPDRPSPAAPPGPARALARRLASDARRRRARTGLRRRPAASRSSPSKGTGVYEIPVGPVHAGLIEPGHFRFSVVGETILRLKARLWFVHRGLEKLFHGRDRHGRRRARRTGQRRHLRRPCARPQPGRRGRARHRVAR